MNVARDHLRSFVDRIERTQGEIDELNQDKRDIYAEARAMGLDAKALKQVIKLRKMDNAERLEREAIVETYMAALGMLPDFETDEEQPQPNGSRAPAPAHEAIHPDEPDERAAQPAPAAADTEPAGDPFGADLMAAE